MSSDDFAGQIAKNATAETSRDANVRPATVADPAPRPASEQKRTDHTRRVTSLFDTMGTNSNRRSKRRSTRAEQLRLPFEDADIRQNSKLRGVYRDHHAHHAIVYKIGKTRISFVEMKKGELVTRSLTDIKFFSVRGFERIEYPVARAVEGFLRHNGGVSDAARRALLSLVKPKGVARPSLHSGNA